jgi:hypothetical protein
MTAIYMLGSFGLALNICRLITGPMQTPLSYSICIAIGTAVGVPVAYGHARMTFSDGIWTTIEDCVAVVAEISLCAAHPR